MAGHHATTDQDVAEGRGRDQLGRAGLQHEADDQDHWHAWHVEGDRSLRIACRHLDVGSARHVRLTQRLAAKRFYTASTQSRHSPGHVPWALLGRVIRPVVNRAHPP